MCSCCDMEAHVRAVSQLLLEGPPPGEDNAVDALRADVTRLLLNRCVCWSRAKIFMQIIKRYEMLITYKPPNESFK